MKAADLLKKTLKGPRGENCRFEGIQKEDFRERLVWTLMVWTLRKVAWLLFLIFTKKCNTESMFNVLLLHGDKGPITAFILYSCVLSMYLNCAP